MKKPKNFKRIILGVTGSIGTGKSTVARILKNMGAVVIDADKIAHDFIRPGNAAYKKIICIFGLRVLDKNKFINRERLAKIVFRDNTLLDKLNHIVHPEVIKFIKESIKKSRNKVTVLDVPLLFESGLEKEVDKVIVVKAAKSAQVTRLLKKGGLKKADILKRINAQMPLQLKVRKADFIIDNSGNVNKTKQQVEDLRRKLWKS